MLAAEHRVEQDGHPHYRDSLGQHQQDATEHLGVLGEADQVGRLSQGRGGHRPTDDRGH